MKRLRELPLRPQLFSAILLLLVPVLAGTIWSGVATYRERVGELGVEARLTAATVAGSVGREITAQRRITRNVEAQRTLENPDLQNPDRIARQVLADRPGLLNVVLRRTSGRDAGRAVGAADESSSSAWSDAVFAGGKAVLMTAGALGSTHISRVVFGNPITDSSGDVTGAIGFLVDVQRLQDAFTPVPLADGSIVAIRDAEWRILSRNLEPDRYVGRLTPAPGGGSASADVRESLDGVVRIYANAEIEGTPWVLTVGIPESVALDRTTAQWTRNLSVLVLGLAGWFVVAVVLSRRFATSVSYLDAAAKRIAAGDFRPLERQTMPTREFSELQKAFDQMLQRFNDTRATLDAQMAEERSMREEVQSLQRQVIRQERLAAVGQLVSGVAHEINNPLQAILGFAELLQMQTQLPDDVKADLKLIQKESGRACGIIRNLALFARQQTGEAAPLALGDVIRSVAELRQRRLESENIELRVEDSSHHHVLAALPELQQVVLNFVVNAEQSIMVSGRFPGRITVRTRDESDHVVLEVEDTGPGIPPENEAKLFQPFYTTKPVGQGTGLGLSVSYGIIDSLGGRIGYRRAPTGGAIFYFELAAVSDTA
jgi:signal transduction histidine kinase